MLFLRLLTLSTLPYMAVFKLNHVPAYKHFNYSHGNNVTTMTIIYSATAIIAHRCDMGSVVIELKLV